MEAIIKEKITIRITWIKNEKGKLIPEVLIGLDYVCDEGILISTKIEKFRGRYLNLVKKAQKIIPQKKAEYRSKNSKKRSKNKVEKKASFYWKLGNLFRTFNNDIKNEFEIINYANALQCDFGLTHRYVSELMIFSELFSEKEIIDSIPMAIYRALVWKKSQLEEIGELTKEKVRLLERGKNKDFIGRENYKQELTALVRSKNFGG